MTPWSVPPRHCAPGLTAGTPTATPATPATPAMLALQIRNDPNGARLLQDARTRALASAVAGGNPGLLAPMLSVAPDMPFTVDLTLMPPASCAGQLEALLQAFPPAPQAPPLTLVGSPPLDVDPTLLQRLFTHPGITRLALDETQLTAGQLDALAGQVRAVGSHLTSLSWAEGGATTAQPAFAGLIEALDRLQTLHLDLESMDASTPQAAWEPLARVLTDRRLRSFRLDLPMDDLPSEALPLRAFTQARPAGGPCIGWEKVTLCGPQLDMAGPGSAGALGDWLAMCLRSPEVRQLELGFCLIRDSPDLPVIQPHEAAMALQLTQAVQARQAPLDLRVLSTDAHSVDLLIGAMTGHGAAVARRIGQPACDPGTGGFTATPGPANPAAVTCIRSLTLECQVGIDAPTHSAVPGEGVPCDRALQLVIQAIDRCSGLQSLHLDLHPVDPDGTVRGPAPELLRRLAASLDMSRVADLSFSGAALLPLPHALQRSMQRARARQTLVRLQMQASYQGYAVLSPHCPLPTDVVACLADGVMDLNPRLHPAWTLPFVNRLQVMRVTDAYRAAADSLPDHPLEPAAALIRLNGF